MAILAITEFCRPSFAPEGFAGPRQLLKDLDLEADIKRWNRENIDS
jgi:hypothetical protein